MYQSRIQLFFLRKVVRQSHTDVTSFCMQFEKIVSYFPSLFGLTKHSPSLQKASRSNPHPIFSNCTQNDVMSVHICLMTFRKKTVVYYWEFTWVITVSTSKKENIFNFLQILLSPLHVIRNVNKGHVFKLFTKTF